MTQTNVLTVAATARPEPNGIKRRGFASMTPDKRRKIAAMGGVRAHQLGKAHEFTPQEASAAGKLGGKALARSKPRSYFAALGGKGGESTAQDRDHMVQIGRKGGQAVSRNREHMAQIGRKGGQHGRGSQKPRRGDATVQPPAAPTPETPTHV